MGRTVSTRFSWNASCAHAMLHVAGAQLRPIAGNDSRQHVVARLLELMREAKARCGDVVVFPELALTTCFPRWWMEDEAEIDSFFESEKPGPATRPLFEADRRWPETYRGMGMQSVEVVLLGYDMSTHLLWVPVYDRLADFHNHLCMQAGAYQNSTWVVGIAKAGNEEGCELLAGSCIVAPSGEIVAMATTNSDEVFTARCNLDISRYKQEAMFNFAEHCRIEHYQLITQQAGAFRRSRNLALET